MTTAASARLQLEMIATHLTTAYTGATKTLKKVPRLGTWVIIELPSKGIGITIDIEHNGTLDVEIVIPRGKLCFTPKHDALPLDVANRIIQTITALTEGDTK